MYSIASLRARASLPLPLKFTDAEVAHYSKFTLLLYWGVDLHPEGGHRFVPDQEAKSLAQAAKFKAANPDILLFPYITGRSKSPP